MTEPRSTPPSATPVQPPRPSSGSSTEARSIPIASVGWRNGPPARPASSETPQRASASSRKLIVAVLSLAILVGLVAGLSALPVPALVAIILLMAFDRR